MDINHSRSIIETLNFLLLCYTAAKSTPVVPVTPMPTAVNTQTTGKVTVRFFGNVEHRWEFSACCSGVTNHLSPMVQSVRLSVTTIRLAHVGTRVMSGVDEWTNKLNMYI